MRDARLNQRELIATESCDCIHPANGGPQAFGQRTQQQVTDRMPERVINVFEMVKVKIENGETLRASLGALNGLL